MHSSRLMVMDRFGQGFENDRADGQLNARRDLTGLIYQQMHSRPVTACGVNDAGKTTQTIRWT